VKVSGQYQLYSVSYDKESPTPTKDEETLPDISPEEAPGGLGVVSILKHVVAGTSDEPATLIFGVQVASKNTGLSGLKHVCMRNGQIYTSS
jgi:hypothetical protein